MSKDELGFQVVSYDSGEMIFSEGDGASEAYLIMNGSVEVFSISEKGKFFIAKLGEGEILGEMAIITKQNRMASAIALEKTTLAVISEKSLTLALTDNLTIVRTLIDQLIQRLRDMSQRYESKERS